MLTATSGHNSTLPEVAHVRQRQRRLVIGLFFTAAVPLLVASVAFACQRITPAHATPESGPAGASVRMTGSNFSSEGTSSNVEIRWDRRDGPSLASIAPAALGDKGSFDVTVTVPADAAIGNHILIATQTLANGAPCVGCPGRANFHVTAASAQASSNSAAAAPASDQQTSAPAAPTEPAPATEPAATQPVAAASQQPTQPATQPAPASKAAPAPAPVSVQGPVAPAPAAPVAAAAPADAAPAASPVVASPVPAAPASAVQPAPAPAGVELVGRSSSGQERSPLPGLTLVAGLVLVLLGLGAFWKSGRSAFGGEHVLTPAG